MHQRMLHPRIAETGTAAVWLLSLALFATSETTAAETQFLPNSAEAGTRIRVVVDTALLHVTVRDPNGSSIAGLQEDDFEVMEDGVPRQIVYFSPGDGPLSVVLLIDTSISMRIEAMDEAKRVALQFVERNHPTTEFALVAFDDRVRKLSGFTRDRDSLTQLISGLEAEGRGTRLYDALEKGFQILESADNMAQVIVLLTDGKDEGSRRTFAEIESRAAQGHAAIFSCGLYNPAYRNIFLTGRKYYVQPETEENLNPEWVLKHLASVTGSQAFFPEPGQAVDSAFDEIVQDLQSRYIIGYAQGPTGGGWAESVKVRLRSLFNFFPVEVFSRRTVTAGAAPSE
jgi:VWFA-related protein